MDGCSRDKLMEGDYVSTPWSKQVGRVLGTIGRMVTIRWQNGTVTDEWIGNITKVEIEDLI